MLRHSPSPLLLLPEAGPCNGTVAGLQGLLAQALPCCCIGPRKVLAAVVHIRLFREASQVGHMGSVEGSSLLMSPPHTICCLLMSSLLTSPTICCLRGTTPCTPWRIPSLLVWHALAVAAQKAAAALLPDPGAALRWNITLQTQHIEVL